MQPALRQQGLREMAHTSNGTLLNRERAQSLKAAGLDRLTLSLDGASGASVAKNPRHAQMAYRGGLTTQSRARRSNIATLAAAIGL